MGHKMLIYTPIFLVIASLLGVSATDIPGANSTLEDVWEWMSSVAKDSNDGIININMYMSGNKMSMTDTFFTMDVETEAFDRMTKVKEENDDEEIISWSWSPSNNGGSISMHMYNNSMSMVDTVFTMGSDMGSMNWNGSSVMEINGENLERSGKKGQSGLDNFSLNINMYMYDNQMAMNKTVFTFN